MVASTTLKLLAETSAMVLSRFTSYLMYLRWPHRVLVVISLAVIAAGMIAPPLFILFGGTFGPPILVTALITAVLVVSPLCQGSWHCFSV